MRSAREAPALCGLPLTDRDAASSCGLFGLATVVAFAVVTTVAGFLVFEGGRSARFGALGPLPGTFEPFPSLGGYLASEDFDQRDPTATRTTLRSEDRFPGGSPEGIHKIRTLQGLDSGAMLEERPRAAGTARSERGSRIRRRAVAFDAGSDLEAWGGERDGGVVAKELPSVEESTIMFLHVYKCAGSTLRRMLVDWAEADGQRGAIVHKCDHTSEEREVCLSHYQLIDQATQREQISRMKMLAGHFIWGFQRHVKGPYLMITALRNPLEVFVSGQQYLHRKKTKTLEKAHEFVGQAMRRVIKSAGSPTGTTDGIDGRYQKQLGGYIRRFVGKDKKVLDGEALAAAAGEAIRNLETFWIVGVVEQYAGFEEVLRRSLDPRGKHRELWDKYSSMKYNSSPVGSRDVLAGIDSEVVRHFNGSLALQWRVYEAAVSLWSVRCQEVLPSKAHQEMCRVPSPAETYVR